MAFPPSFLEELKNRISIAEIVGRRVKLTRKGREHSGLCPFHNEKTPSFTVSEDKGFYHCFGCGAHGSAFDFIMEMDGLSFPEAVERLAGEAGMQVPQATPEERERQKRAATLHEVVERACALYEATLYKPEGKAGLDYLRRRGLDEDTIKRFRLGFAPNGRDAVRKALRNEQTSEAMLIEAGLVGKPDDGGAPYDRLRGRVMFPISDRRGRVIAFGGRTLGDGQPKYLNTPDTPLFHKGEVLYGLSQALKPSRDAGRVIVTEGYMDVIALARAGFGEAVAPLGTAVTESHLRLLWRLADEPILCFDGDNAGRRAAMRAATRALPLLEAGRSLRFALLPQGEDPDSLIAARGAEAMEGVLNQTANLADIVWEMETAGHRFDTPERIAGLEKRLDAHVFAIEDQRVQSQYRAHFRDLVWNRIRKRGGDRRSGGSGASIGGGKAGFAARSGPERLGQVPERILMATILNHPRLLNELDEDLGRLNLTDPKLDNLRQEILKLHADVADLDSDGIHTHLQGLGAGEVLVEILSRDTYIHARFARPETPESEAREGFLQVMQRVHATIRQRELEEAAEAFAQDPTTENWQRFEQLKTLGQMDQSDIDGTEPGVRASMGSDAIGRTVS